jgi:hypothetical protein
MHRELAVDGADIVRGADHAGELQIVMRFKQRPETSSVFQISRLN